ncbi:MAG: alpha/beta hydrolase [Pseudomonadota bacterium]
MFEALKPRSETAPRRAQRYAAPNSALPQSSPNDPRKFETIRPGSGTIELQVMDYQKDATDLRPLLILSPLEFPYPPSIDFCESMKRNGFRVIFVHRLGFGGSQSLPPQLMTEANIKIGAAMVTEVAVIMSLIAHMNLKNIVLLGISTGNTICSRLSQISSDVRLTVFSHPIFNQDTLQTVRPEWVQPLARQIILTKGGFRIAANGLRFYIRRNPTSFYDQMYAKSVSDLQYRKDNADDFLAAAKFVEKISAETLYYEVIHTMAEDSFLRDGLFLNVPAVVLAGKETTTDWLSNTTAEAERLGIPYVQAESGGIFTAYTSPDLLLQVIQTHSA